MKKMKFLLRGLMFEVAYDRTGAEIRDDSGPSCYNEGDWILTLCFGPCELVGFNDDGAMVTWDGQGRTTIKWADVYDMNRYGSINGDFMAKAS